jgi:hypothetical protein
MPGLRPQTKEFYAPETATVSLEPGRGTENEFKSVLENYFGALDDAFYTLNAASLPEVAGGTQLEGDLVRINDLASRGLRQQSDLLSLKYQKFKVLAPDVATVETDEVWNFTIYSGANPVSAVTNQKQKMVYTLQRDGDGPWKVTESKQR